MDKGELRRVMTSLPSAEEAAGVVEGLYHWMATRLPGTVSAYLAMDGEIDVAPLFTRLPGWRWLLPRIEPDRALTMRDRDLPREVHPWGMEQPVATGDAIPFHELDLVLVPGLAFDRSGARLGRGGGFYDRLLTSTRPDCPAVGVTFSARVVASVPTEEHDMSVDFLATEEGVSPCSPRS